ncbi:hypothetical protein [uncultured Gammaproteobacteria bacterium]|nr:hypothetical protein [uncultured Gammaproteobacteria bacterium]
MKTNYKKQLKSLEELKKINLTNSIQRGINMAKSRNYTSKTLKRLFALSGNQCAFPNCNKEMTNKDNAQDSNICHIEAKNSKGKRYNSNMTDSQRDDYPNLIVLCVQHHDLIDNDADTYVVEVLKEMKQKHEIEITKKLSPLKTISVIDRVVHKISEIDIEQIGSSEIEFSFKPEDKIQYNNIKIYKPLFDEYKIYSSKLNAIYDEIDAEGSLKKIMLLRNIKSIYLKIKGQLGINSQADIQNQADNIIEQVESELLNKIGNDLDEENIEFAIKVILVDAFMRCKILEEPLP